MPSISNPKNFTFVHQFNPLGNRIGGIGKYIISFIKCAPEYHTYRIVGLCNHRKDLFKWVKISLSGKSVYFLPVAVVSNENKKSLFPLSIKFTIGLLFARLNLLNKSSYYLMQRPEYNLAFYACKNPKYLFIHNDIEMQISPEYSEVLWAKFPKLYIFLLKKLILTYKTTFSVNNKSVNTIRNFLPEYDNNIFFSPTWADDTLFFRPLNKSIYDEKLKISNKFKLPVDLRWLIFVGRLQKVKNVNLIVESMLSINNTILLIAGEGNEKNDIELLVSKYNLDSRVFFLGNVEHRDISKFICSSDLFISSSFSEGMSIALIESLMCGVPVVTTPTGESKLIIKEGHNGFITDNWSVDSMTSAIKKGLNLSGQVHQNCMKSVSEYQGNKIVNDIIQKIISS